MAVTSFKATNSVFNITEQNNRISYSTPPSDWSPKSSEEILNRLLELLELRSQVDIELHVKKVEKRGTRIETEKSGYNLAAFDQFKS